MRYEIVHWFETDDEDDYTEVVEVLARAADTDGLFSDPVPVERERVVLRGCPPEFAGLSGHYNLEAGTDDEWQWWSLTDLVVHGTVPIGDLVDVVASAAVRLTDDGPGLGPRCTLFQGDVVGECAGVDGFPRRWEGHDEWPPVTLIGADHPERLQPLNRRKHAWASGERLHALDRHGRVMARVPIDLTVTSVTPSALGDGLFDVVLDQSCCADASDRPVPSARAVWDLWRCGVPAERNLWAPFDTAGRKAWGDLTFTARAEFDSDRPGGVHHLDGRYVTDVPGLYLALGEALLGPGHYFGRCYDAFRDCLGGGWGVGSGFTLVWHDAHVAHGAMRGLFLDVVQLVRSYGNRVELDSTVDGIEEIDRIMAFPDLVDRWLHGWAAAARLSTLRRPSSWHVRVDRPGRRVERILTSDSSAAWHATQSGSEDWLTVPTTSPDEVETAVREAGMTLRPRETFMRRARRPSRAGASRGLRGGGVRRGRDRGADPARRRRGRERAARRGR